MFLLQADITYDEYLKKFYPNQEENVFTCNSWTLSDEVIEIFKSNFFYAEHVRWNVQRFRPTDVLVDEIVTEDTLQEPLTQASGSCHPKKKITDDSAQEIPPELGMNNDEGGETRHSWSTSLRSKRKVIANDDVDENAVRTQPRRMKKK